MIIGKVYRLHRETNNDYGTFNKEFICLLNSFDHLNCNILVAGDFNMNLLDIVKRWVVGDFFNAVTSHVLLPLIICQRVLQIQEVHKSITYFVSYLQILYKVLLLSLPIDSLTTSHILPALIYIPYTKTKK